LRGAPREEGITAPIDLPRVLLLVRAPLSRADVSATIVRLSRDKLETEQFRWDPLAGELWAMSTTTLSLEGDGISMAHSYLSTLASRGLEEPAHASRGLEELFLQQFLFWREIGFGFTYYLCT
jgi:hypothetical protein